MSKITIQITMPVPLDDIPGEVARIRAEIKESEATTQALRTFLEAVRSFCPHTRKEHDSDPRGGGSTCLHCGKSW